MSKLNRSGNEINFRLYEYYVQTPESLRVLTPEKLYELVNYPCGHCNFDMKGFKMASTTEGNSTLLAAHLPNFTDMHGMVDLEVLQNKLEVLALEEHEVHHSKSVIFDFIKDPAPQLDYNSPIYSLTNGQVALQIGCFSDALQVFAIPYELKVLEIELRRCRLICHELVHALHIRINTSQTIEKLCNQHQFFVIWNARGVARPSFPNNLGRLIQLHKPVILLITESRICKETLKTHYQDLVESWDWEAVDCIGISGGVLMLWRKSFMEVALNADNGESRIGIRMKAKVKLLSFLAN